MGTKELLIKIYQLYPNERLAPLFQIFEWSDTLLADCHRGNKTAAMEVLSAEPRQS